MVTFPPHASHYGVRDPLSSKLCLCLSRRPRSSNSEPPTQGTTPVTLPVIEPARPVACSWLSGLDLRTPRGSDPPSPRYTHLRVPATGWLLAPSGPPFPFSVGPRPSSSLPPSGRRPRRSPDHLPARFAAARPGVARQALSVAGLGVEVGSGRGAATGKQPRGELQPRQWGIPRMLGWAACRRASPLQPPPSGSPLGVSLIPKGLTQATLTIARS